MKKEAISDADHHALHAALSARSSLEPVDVEDSPCALGDAKVEPEIEAHFQSLHAGLASESQLAPLNIEDSPVLAPCSPTGSHTIAGECDLAEAEVRPALPGPAAPDVSMPAGDLAEAEVHPALPGPAAPDVSMPAGDGDTQDDVFAFGRHA